MEHEALKLALEALEAVNPSLVCDMAHHSKKYQHGIGQTCPLEIRHLETITAIKAALAQPPLPVQPSEEWPGQSNIESIHNACQHRGYCKQMKEQPVQEPVKIAHRHEYFKDLWNSYGRR